MEANKINVKNETANILCTFSDYAFNMEDTGPMNLTLSDLGIDAKDSITKVKDAINQKFGVSVSLDELDTPNTIIQKVERVLAAQ